MTAGRPADRGPWAELLRLLRGSGFIFGCRVAGAGLTLVTQLLLARWMGAAELGLYVLAFSWAILLASLSTLGFIPAAMRFVALGQARGEPGYGRSFHAFAERVVLAFSLLLAGSAAAAAWWLPAGVGPDPGLVLIAMAFMPVMALMQFTAGVANGYAQFGLGFLPTNVLRPLIFSLLVVAAWLLAPQLDARLALYLQAAAVGFVAVPSWLAFRGFLRRQGAPGAGTADRGLWLRTALRLLAAMLFTGYFPEMIIILAGNYLASDALAVLHVSFRIAMLVSFGLFAVDAFTGPDMARLHAAGDRAGLVTVVNRATRLRFWASVAAVLMFAVLGRWLLGLFGPEFVAGYPLLLILAAGQLVQAGVGPVVRLLSISGHEERCLKVFAAALVLAVALIAVLTPRWGVTGAAVAAALDILFWAGWMRILAARHVGVRPRFL